MKHKPEIIAEKVINPPIKEIKINKNDDILLQVLHQNAAFDPSSALSTAFIYENLPFSITKRGLRKKLNSLVEKDLIGSKKDGNDRKWFVKTGKISQVKSIIKARNYARSKTE